LDIWDLRADYAKDSRADDTDTVRGITRISGISRIGSNAKLERPGDPKIKDLKV
jgi:hypothetical protein